MFEEQYRKYCREIKPSEALNDETLALMKEARDHRTTPPPKPLKWKPAVVLPIAGTAAAAAVALVIVGVWLTRGGGDLNEELGDMDAAFSNGSTDSEGIVPEDQAPALNDDLADIMDKNNAGTDQSTDSFDTNAGSSNESTGNSNESTGGSNNGTGSSDEDSFDDSSDGANENNGSSKPSDPTEENKNMNEETAGSAAPQDPYGPEISQDKNIKTYLTIRDFIDALTQKEAPGYGSNYYNARELLIVPNLLPDGARFRHLYLDTRTGKYFYSYHFTKDQKDYIIDIEVDATTPKSLNELRLFKEHAANEQVLTAKEGDRLYYQFGEQDLVTVTLTDVTATEPLTLEETATLLAQFGMERCSLLNPVLDMKY